MSARTAGLAVLIMEYVFSSMSSLMMCTLRGPEG